MKKEKIDIIISSPLKRAKQTAEIINKQINCSIIYKEELSERNFGEFEGKKKTEFDFSSCWSYRKNLRYEKAENIKDLFKRIYNALEDIINKYQGKNILIVSHGGVSIPIECYFNGIPDKEDLISLQMYDNCGIKKYII